MATPTTCKPCEPYFCCSSTNQGISILQGTHQVAQKFNRTALPWKSDRRVVLPSSDSREKSGATVDRVMRGVDNLPERRAMWRPTYSINATTKATMTSASGLRFMDPLPLNWLLHWLQILERKFLRPLQGKTIQERTPIRDQSKTSQDQQDAERN